MAHNHAKGKEKVTGDSPPPSSAPTLPSHLLNEHHLSLTELARSLGVHPNTPVRWVAKGVHGVRLESFKLGGKRRTTREAFQRWVDRTSGGNVGGLKTAVADCNRLEAIERAERLLREEGL